jgi:uncharacterized protein (TIGR03492 family)
MRFMKMCFKKVLFISNGHGEDLNASQVLKALQLNYPNIQVAALPMVGEGNAYRKLGVDIITPTLSLPSGGFVYMDKRQLLTDIQKGLLKLTWQQIKAARAFTKDCNLIFATGDIVPLALARITGCPYTAFIVSSSAHYENRMQPPFLMNWLMGSSLCKTIFTRDAFTAQLMQQQGISNAIFAGYPIMDVLKPMGMNLELKPEIPMIALLPGSRLPEACHNLGIMLDLAVAIAREFSPNSVQFRAALVPKMMESEVLMAIAIEHGWNFDPPHRFVYNHVNQSQIELTCFSTAFADILHKSNLAIGMAGTAVEQAVGLGKPVIQILGQGPQFTYSFADAQMRLLGISVQTIGKTPATPNILNEAAQTVKLTLQNSDYLEACKVNGTERVGLSGGSARIADFIAQLVQ